MAKFLDGLKSLIYEQPDDEGKEDNSSQQEGNLQRHVVVTPSVVQSADTQQYVKMFHDAILKSDEIARVFIQFLYNISFGKQNSGPKASEYKQAMQLIQITNPKLTVDDIKNSLERLIAFVRTETESYTKQGNSKIAEIESRRRTERSALETAIAEVGAKIKDGKSKISGEETKIEKEKSALEAAIADLRARSEKTIADLRAGITTLQQNLQTDESELTRIEAELPAVDGKYQTETANVNGTLAAIKLASDQTCESLEQFLTDVTNYLK